MEQVADNRMELLAPAGDWAALEAAVGAGADAVYFGLTILNARRGARNFGQEDLGRVVELVHGKGARAYLTLNIDVAQREMGQAVRVLAVARRAGVDGVLVRDPGVLGFGRLYPELEFHLSTQTCMSNSADVAAAREMGAKRVVLAREMTLKEIAAASAVEGVETEVFVQGALCFSVCGRCMMSSWVGGRSGNRGTCTSPCRVPWTVEGKASGTPMSMRDLAAVGRLEELRKAGVRALKIEGRLKTAEWVGKAVGLYKRAMAGEDDAALLAEASELGAYTGRLLTCDYLDGKRDELTGMAGGRRGVGVSGCRSVGVGVGEEPSPQPSPGVPGEGEEVQGLHYDIDITVGERGIVCRCVCNGRVVEWGMPKTVVKREHKAVAVGRVLEMLEGMEMSGCRLGKGTTNEAVFLMVPRAVSGLMEAVAKALRQMRKVGDGDVIRVDLPEAVREMLERRGRSAANDLALGQRADRVRLQASGVAGFLKRVRASGSVEKRPDGVIVEQVSAEGLGRVVSACGEDVSVVVALPAVFFEEEIGGIRQLLGGCAAAGVGVEVNSWGGWHLAKEAGVAMEGGAGLGVLNAVAARVLSDAGMGCVTLSMEADRKQLEDVAGQCPVACSMVVFGRPALMTTRVQLDREMVGKVFVDRRGVRMVPRMERGLCVFRPAEGFDLRQTRNERIRVRHLVVDLVGSPDAAGEWLRVPQRDTKPFRFNYDRTLV
ncbi:MAG: U32 family peptidase [Planctomycetota bacterium]|nr:U32 family peptidase [Planctomycetota bacterium]